MNQSVIAINQGTLHLLHLLAKILGEAVSHLEEEPKPDGTTAISFDTDKISACILKNPVLRTRFAGVLRAYIEEGDPRAFAPWVQHGGKQITSALLSGAEWFILAHEAAHEFLGHLEAIPERAHHNRAFFGLEIDVFNHEHETELAADCLAAKIVVRLGNQLIPPSLFCPAGIGLCFGVLRILEEAHNVLSFDTHPPAANRFRELKAEYERITRSTTWPPRDKGDAFLPFSFIEVFDECIGRCWKGVRQEVLKPT